MSEANADRLVAGLRVRRRGSGEPAVLLHGVGSRLEVFEPVTELLAGHLDVIAVDLPGFGASQPAAAGDGGVVALADAVERLLAALGLGRVHLVGSSMGGGIALELAGRDRARSVTAFAPIGMWRRPGLLWCRTLISSARRLARVVRPVLPALLATRGGRAGVLAAFYGHPLGVRVERGRADIEAFVAAPGTHAALRGFGHWRVPPPGVLAGVPITVVWGARDVVLPMRTQAARARRLLPAARHLQLPGCGHLPFPDDPAACLSAVLRTVDEARTSAD